MQIGINGCLDGGTPVGAAQKYFGEAGFVRDVESAVERALTQIRIHDQHAGTAGGHGNRQVGGGHGFAVAGDRTGDEERARPRLGVSHVKQRGAQVAIRLDKRMALILRLQGGDDDVFANLAFTGNLAEHIFVK